MRDVPRQGLAVGSFDGVHLGHREILRGASAALTFRNHPLTVLAPERAPRLIMSVDDRVAAIRACGVADVVVLDFTRELAELTAGEFVAFLVARWDNPMIRCGANWRFGKGGTGDAAFLRQAGVAVEVAPFVAYKGEKVSSSRIRACLERGEIEDANAMLGRRFNVEGRRTRGKGLGSKIGYPTINIHLVPSASRLRLPRGVYEVELDGQKGIANFGVAPTMGEEAWTEPVLEVHLLHGEPQAAELGPSNLTAVEVVRFIRPERKFASLEALTRQIAADCATIRT